MAEGRDAKDTIRGLWVGAVRSLVGTDEKPPLYLTLPGEAGLDIECLIQAGVVDRAENDAIAAHDLWKVVAVERSSEAALNLKRRFVGLKVVADDIGNVLRSTGPTTWPDGAHRELCRARVVNLDLQSALRAEYSAGKVVFPTVQLISKLAQLHMTPSALDWVLCLTLRAQIDWELEVSRAVQAFLKENFANEPTFATDSETVLGAQLFGRLIHADDIDLRTLGEEEQQALLMVLVPKKIVTETYQQGWSIRTERNLRYGGEEGAARMVTWIMHFTDEPRVAAEPRAVYSESLAATLTGAGRVTLDGELSAL